MVLFLVCYCRHLIGFFLFLTLTVYSAKNVVDLPNLKNIPDVLRKTDLHKLREDLLTCIPSLPNMHDLHKFHSEIKTSFHSSADLLPSLSNWHIVELLCNCLPERFSHSNHTDVCVLVICLSSDPCCFVLMS